ncbi:MmcQ/YjbR family DNA-binding protein [Streptococcus sp. H49]|uniref:MmcQ/YjbR family DNA-binding protein n=1 Tax=Streptococcus huangxiaojuni TaxID=3237239 RepID=UPI0034A46786
MSLESEFFKKKRVLIKELLPFGFKKEGDLYNYRELFMDGNFEAQLSIEADGRVSGRVIDTEINDDYLALSTQRQAGSFAGQVRAAYAAILEKIAISCFEDRPFVTEQADRLLHYIEKTYGDQYDHPFAKYPDFAAYRNPINRKWYGLIMTVSRSKLDSGEEKRKHEETEDEVEIINLKVKNDDLAHLLTCPGIYPSYHMNKKSWVSVILDEDVSDELLFSLVDKSRKLTEKGSLGSADGPDFWLIPANPKYYDVDAELAAHKVIHWTQKASIKTDDYVGIYITAPVRSLRYLCRVLEADIPNEAYPDRSETKRLMRIELLTQFPDSRFSSSVLKEYGVTNIRGARRMTKELAAEVKKALKN